MKTDEDWAASLPATALLPRLEEEVAPQAHRQQDNTSNSEAVERRHPSASPQAETGVIGG